MIEENPIAGTGQALPEARRLSYRITSFLIGLPFNSLRLVGRAGFYGVWHLLYFIGGEAGSSVGHRGSCCG